MSERIDTRTGDRADAVRMAAEALRRGELVVVPTDTVYGVAADAFSAAGTQAIFDAKQRGRNLPLPVLVRSPKQVNGLVTHVSETVERLMAAYWPGPLTIVVTADPNLSWDLGDNDGAVALRMPLDDVCLDVIRAVGPLATTSANLSGHPPAADADAAWRHLGTTVSVYLDDGPRRTIRPSTIVDATRAAPAILRDGALPADEVLKVARGELGPGDVAPVPTIEDDLDDAEPV